MTNANGTSERALRISRVVGEIAFQTNILALNAALEAAGTGEAGRGCLEKSVADTSILVAAFLRRSAYPGAGRDEPGGPPHEANRTE